jgi:hypothetical protein
LANLQDPAICDAEIANNVVVEGAGDSEICSNNAELTNHNDGNAAPPGNETLDSLVNDTEGDVKSL